MRALLRPVRRWRPASKAAATAYRYVFVVTYGRSGSTLLQGLLNSLPGYRIRGENYNVLYRLYQADAALTKAYDEYHRTGWERPTSAWYGIGETRPAAFRADLVESFVRNVLRPRAGDRVLGFKEIRYTPVHQDDLAKFLTFLRKAFPGCKIVFNHRDPAAVAASAWWVNVDDALAKIQAADERFYTFADAHHFHYRYDDLDDSLSNVRDLMAFLGAPFDETAIRAVLNTTHGPFTKA